MQLEDAHIPEQLAWFFEFCRSVVAKCLKIGGFLVKAFSLIFLVLLLYVVILSEAMKASKKLQRTYVR